MSIVKSVLDFLKNFKLEIFDVENTKTHGGSNRYYIKKNINSLYKISNRVKIEIKNEMIIIISVVFPFLIMS